MPLAFLLYRPGCLGSHIRSNRCPKSFSQGKTDHDARPQGLTHYVPPAIIVSCCSEGLPLPPTVLNPSRLSSKPQQGRGIRRWRLRCASFEKSPVSVLFSLQGANSWKVGAPASWDLLQLCPYLLLIPRGARHEPSASSPESDMLRKSCCPLCGQLQRQMGPSRQVNTVS